MDTAIIASLFGIVGAILGALIQTFGKDVIERAFPSNKQREVVGNWSVQWKENQPENTSDIINDIVNLSVDKRGKITGKGSSPLNQYKLQGWDSTFAITLTYSGLDMEENLVGTVLLRKSMVKDKMDGIWCQVTRENKLIGGDCSWIKHN